MKRLMLNDISIEVTRRCNILCEHCMRGDAENIDLNVSLVRKFFKQVASIRCLTFTGGEPSLVPHIISEIFDIAEEENTEIETFYIATNAVQVTDDFLKVLFKGYLHCSEYYEDEIPFVAISSDIQHDEASNDFWEKRKDNIKKLMAFRFTMKRDKDKDYSKGDVLYEGRASEIYTYKKDTKQTHVSSISFEDDTIDSSIHLNCHGNVLPNGDLSYTTQENPEIILCDVNHSLFRGIQRYNKRIHNEEINDIAIAA